MGMYFNVKADSGDKCRKCNEPMSEWQSKDSIGEMHDVFGGCCDSHPNPMPVLEKNEVENYYGICRRCNHWNEYRRLKNGNYRLIKSELKPIK